MPLEDPQTVLPLPPPRLQLYPAAGTRKVPRQDWASFVEHLGEEWAPGEHASVIAPTGRGGKTYMITRGLLPLWSDYRVLFLDIKDRDLTLMPQRGRPFFRHNVSRMPSRIQVDLASS